MKAHIFKSSNEHIGGFSFDGPDDFSERLKEFVESHGGVPTFSYVEADGKTWTITSLSPFAMQEGRLMSPVASGFDLVAHFGSTIDPSTSVMVTRYRDAYRVGTALVGLGNAVKGLGVVLGILIALLSLSAGSNGGGMAFLVLPGVFVAVTAGTLIWICGVVVAAQGQLLQATLDSAVAASPFLSHLERLDAMGLPRSIANHQAN